MFIQIKKNKRVIFSGIILLSLTFSLFLNILSPPLSIVDKDNAANDDNKYSELPKSSTRILTWWNESWNYRVRIEIRAQEKAISDVPIEKRINFTKLLHEVNDYSRFDWNSTRVVEYVQSTAQWIEIPFVANKFKGDEWQDYNNKTNALVDIFWIMNGTTPKDSNRTYFIYFDSLGNGKKSPPNYQFNGEYYGFGGTQHYTAYNTENLIYRKYFRIADFSASPYRDEQSHYGNANNPFDDVYGYPIVDDLQEDGLNNYEGKVGRVRDRGGRQAHAGRDQRWNMEFYWNNPGQTPYFPIIKVAIKCDNPLTRTSLYVLTDDGWRVIMYTPNAEWSQGSYYVDHTYGCTIQTDGIWRIYEYDLRHLSGTYYAWQIEFYQASGAPNAYYFWFDNLIAMEADSEALLPGNRSYLIPESHVYKAEIKRANIEVKAYDLYGNLIPNVNISMFNHSTLIKTDITNENGSVFFTNLTHGNYNFTATLISNIGGHKKLVNITKTAISINKVFQTIGLICNISSNFFKVLDIDGKPVDSGWIIVGNGTNNLQNCTIDSSGNAKFWWFNSTPYNYNYTIYYMDVNYNPNIIKLISGAIPGPNKTITISVNLTTVHFTVLSYPDGNPVEDAIIVIRKNNPSGVNIVNLTTNATGKAILRWLNSSGIKGNYSIQIKFFNSFKNFNITNDFSKFKEEINFSVSSEAFYDLRIQIDLSKFSTEIISLNPTNYIDVKWGTVLKIRTLFNVTNAGQGPSGSGVGPQYADEMSYEILKDYNTILTGVMSKENDLIGGYQTTIDTSLLNSESSYLIKISATKSGFTKPSDLILSLYILKNDLKLNSSDPSETSQTVYWQNRVNFSVIPYGEISEEITIKDNIFKNSDNSFKIILPEVRNNWNISKIILNFYNITWMSSVDPTDVNITFIDPFGKFWMWHSSKNASALGSNLKYNEGKWENIQLTYNRKSPTGDNTFIFSSISGSFLGTVDIIAQVFFTRDNVYTTYQKFNVTNDFSIPCEVEGWSIKNITFELSNCRNPDTWALLNPWNDAKVNITTNEGFNYSLESYGNGFGRLTIDDRIIYPRNNEFRFTIKNNTNIMFDLTIKVKFRQEFYKNSHLEMINYSTAIHNLNKGSDIEFNVNNIDCGWYNSEALLKIKGIHNSSTFFYPSEISMNLTIGSQIYQINDDQIKGDGYLSIQSLTKNFLYNAKIEVNKAVNFTIEYSLSYSRLTTYKTTGIVSYLIREAPDVYGNTSYDDDLGYYLQTINTSLVNTGKYTVRFTITKDHYKLTEPFDFSLTVLERKTLLNGSSDLITQIPVTIYVHQKYNFTFIYVDKDKGTRIANLDHQSYTWKKYENGQVVDSGSGALITSANNSYILDFNTESLEVGEYAITITLRKNNYEQKIILINLNVIKRIIDYDLGSMFTEKQASVVKGDTLTIQITLTDPTNNSIPLTGAKVILKVGDKNFNFKEIKPGVYEVEFPTDDYEAFFTSNVLSGVIKISKEDYEDKEIDITIVIQMEEGPIPGLPTFYFLMIVGAILAVVISLGTYRAVQSAKIPKFVKKIRRIKSAIQSRKSISDSDLFPSKEEKIAKMFREDWEFLGLSLDEILGIGTTKSKTIKSISKTEGGASE